MTLLEIIVIVSWLWMMTTAFHLDDVRTEGQRSSVPVSVRRRSR